MLTTHLLCTPAAERGRRRLFLSLMSLAVVGPWGLGCHQRPARDEAGFRAAVQRAVVELEVDDPSAAAELAAVMREAEEVTAAAVGSWRWWERQERVTVAWQRVVSEASLRLREQRARRRQTLTRCEALIAVATEQVAAARQRLGQAGMGPAEAAAVTTAAVRLRSAVRSAELGDVTTATASAEDALRLAGAVEGAWQAVIERFDDPELLEEWRHAAEATLRQSRRSGGAAVVVDKLHHRLHLYRHGHLVASLPVELGSNGLRRKVHSGDMATPEGQYRIVSKKAGAATRFFLALLIDYPNSDDRRRFTTAVRAGEVPRGAGIGGLIEIHGEGGSGRDWTEGCVAMANDDMQWLYAQVAVGTPVAIVGTL